MPQATVPLKWFPFLYMLRVAAEELQERESPVLEAL